MAAWNKGMSWEQIYGMERANELKRKKSEFLKKKYLGKGNPLYGKKRLDLSKRNKQSKGKTYTEIYGSKKAVQMKQRVTKFMTEHNPMRGKKRSDLSKRNKHSKGKSMIEICGIKKAKEMNKKRSITLKGRIFSEQHKSKISAAIKGQIRYDMIGKNNFFWSGGISFEPYSLEWTKALKKEIAKRDNSICQYCGKPILYGEGIGCPHHINYNKKDCRSINLVWVCKRCNVLFNWERDFWFAYWCYMQDLDIDKLNPELV